MSKKQAALRDAIQSAIHHPDGEMDEECLRRAIDKGFTEEAVLKATRISRGVRGLKAPPPSGPPNAVRRSSHYFHPRQYQKLTHAQPIHVVCAFSSCPDEVVGLLAKIHPSALNLGCSVTDCKRGHISIGCPLHHYLSRKENANVSTVALLVEMNRDAVTKDVGAGNCLHLACQNDLLPTDVLEYLFRQSPDSLRTKNRDGKVPFQLVLEHWPASACRALMQKFPRVLEHGSEEGALAHSACQTEAMSTDVLEMLMDSAPGAAVDVEDADAIRTFLGNVIASGARSTFVCEKLLGRCPAAAEKENEDGISPLEQACRHGSLPLVQFFYGLHNPGVEAASGWRLIHHASMNNTKDAADIVKFILDKDSSGLDCHVAIQSNEIPHGDWTNNGTVSVLPIHLAALFSNVSVVKLLVEARPETINASSSEGCSPYDYVLDRDTPESHEIECFLDEMGALELAEPEPPLPPAGPPLAEAPPGDDGEGTSPVLEAWLVEDEGPVNMATPYDPGDDSD